MPSTASPHRPDAPERQARRMQPRVRWHWGAGLFLPLWGVWLALNGSNAWALGVVVAAAGALAGAVLAPGDPYPWRPARLLSFALFFVHESVRGGIDVAGRALHRRLPIAPHFIDYPLTLPPGQPRTLMISVVSLLPGTLSVDLPAGTPQLRVHVLTSGGERGLDALQARIAVLFGLDRKNGR